MKKILALLLALTLAVTLCACGGESPAAEETEKQPAQQTEEAGAADGESETETLPAEEPTVSDRIEFSFGEFQIKDMAFCNKAELFINVITWTSSASNRSTESTVPYYYSAKENCLVLAIRGTLTNSSAEDVTYDTMKGTVRFGESEELTATMYPYEKSSEDSFRTLFAGSSAQVTICAQVPVELSIGESVCTLRIGDSQVAIPVAEIPIVDLVEYGGQTDGEEPESDGESEETAEAAETAVTGENGTGEFEEITIETDAGIMVIKGFSFAPGGFKGYSNTDQYDNYSIFTVHATITLKSDEPKSSWSSFHTQAYQNGIDAHRYTDFSKKVHITTDLMPGTPVDIDYDFLVESPTDPITFMVQTWGRAKTVYSQEFEIDGTTVRPKS